MATGVKGKKGTGAREGSGGGGGGGMIRPAHPITEAYSVFVFSTAGSDFFVSELI